MGSILGWVGGFLLGSGITYVVTRAAKASSAGTWQALVAPFTVAPNASVVMVDSQPPVSAAGAALNVTALGLELAAMVSAGKITNFQSFAPGATLPADWPTNDTYPKTVSRYEFTNGTSSYTPVATPAAVWQLVPASS